MEIIKKQNVKAYILMESLVAMGVLAMIVGLVFGQLKRSQTDLSQKRREEELYQVLAMALQSKQDHLTANGQSVSIMRQAKEIVVYDGNKEVFRLEKP